MKKEIKYSSPSAYLNRFFKKRKKFKYIMSETDSYENKEFLLTHLEEETFLLEEWLPMERDTGYIGLKEMHAGSLVECVQKIREFYKEGKY